MSNKHELEIWIYVYQRSADMTSKIDPDWILISIHVFQKLSTLYAVANDLLQADVIVDNTASSLQLKNGGLSESLLEMAGPEMQDECDNNYPNGIKIGEIAVTGGYGLNCKKVYHGTLSKWSDKSQNAITVSI